MRSVASLVLCPLVQWLVDVVLSAAHVNDPLLLCPARCKAEKSVFEDGLVADLSASIHDGSDLSRTAERAYIDLLDVDVESCEQSVR